MHLNNAISSTSKRIMLIDDKVCTRFLYRWGLEMYGFTVDTFSNPLVALESFKSELYDLVMIGIAMEKMNGFELCKELEKKTTSCEFKRKFCFITNFDPYRDVLLNEYSEISHYPFIITRITIEELVDILTKYLELKEKPYGVPVSNERMEEILNEERAKSNYVPLPDI
jgi:DNA-binding NtrC family response regulator